MGYKLDNAKKEFDNTFMELKDRIQKGECEEGVNWSYYVVKYLPIPLAKAVMYVHGFVVCQAKIFWYGREQYKVMLNKEIAKMRQIETQMLKDEERGKNG
jgi:hypothetical protein